MDTSRLIVVLVFTFTLLPASSSAQEVEFDIPSEIDIVQGQLSITFQDAVTEETARRLVTGLGYEVIDAIFEPRLVWANLQNRLSNRQIRQLTSDSRVIDIAQTAIPQPVQTTTHDEHQANNPQYSLVLTLTPTVSRKEAMELLASTVDAVFSRMEKRPNELIIEVGDQDAEAFATLEDRDEVKWVTYVGVAGGF